MPILRKILFRAARHLATDPQARRMAADAYRNEVRPRAEAAWKSAKPRIDETRSDLGRIAEETDARRHPARFAGRATRRVFHEFRRRPKG